MNKILSIRTLRIISDNLKSKTCPELSRRIENLKLIGLVALVVTFALCGMVAEAQQPVGKIPRIGFLTAASASDPRNMLRLETLRQGLRELGYVEGKNINFEYRFAEGKSEQLPRLAEELVRLKVDILFAMDSSAARSAKKSTTTIPVIVTTGDDPVRTGWWLVSPGRATMSRG